MSLSEQNLELLSKEELKLYVLKSNPTLDWKYLAEGNMHIVFTFNGDQSYLETYVLVINKEPNMIEDVYTARYLANEWFTEMKTTDICNYHSIVHPIHLKAIFVTELISKCNHQRLQRRRTKHPLSLFSNNACSENDTYFEAHLETNALQIKPMIIAHENTANIIIFELKPKWMFIYCAHQTSTRVLHPLNIKRYVCRFCMHQYLKLNEGKITDICHYCPLSLIQNLHQSKKQQLIENIQHLFKFCVQMKSQSFLKIFHSKDSESKSNSSNMEYFDVHMDTFADILIENRLMFEKLAILQNLNGFGIECISEMFKELKYKRKRAEIIQLKYNNDDEESVEWMNNILQTLSKEHKNIQQMKNMKTCQISQMLNVQNIAVEQKYNNLVDKHYVQQLCKTLSDEKLAEYISHFLISAIFKDVSIMFTIDMLSKQYSIKFLDLSTKPIERIERKWLKLDREIVNYFLMQVVNKVSYEQGTETQQKTLYKI